jgi:hypothetical protein
VTAIPGASEFQTHAAIVSWLKVALPSAIVVHPLNNPRSAVAGAKAKRMGMLAGAPDLIIIHYGKMFCIEVKTQKGRQSPAQVAFQERCTEHGVPYCIARGIGDVQSFLHDLNIPVRAA